jgi:hypothetical protein
VPAYYRIGGHWLVRAAAPDRGVPRHTLDRMLSGALTDVIQMQSIRRMLAHMGHFDVHRMDDHRALCETERAVRIGALRLVSRPGVSRGIHERDAGRAESVLATIARLVPTSPAGQAYGQVDTPDVRARPGPGDTRTPAVQATTPADATGLLVSPAQATAASFESRDDAARAALEFANPLSKAENLEYGGLLYKDPNTGKFGYSGPVKGDDQGVTPSQAKLPDGMELVGDYHTHGDYSIQDDATGAAIRTGNPRKDDFDSDRFSKTDRDSINHCAQIHPGYRGYLGTPSGIFKIYDASTKVTSIL